MRAVRLPALFVALLALSACSSDDAGGSQAAAPQAAGPGPVYAQGGLGDVTGPSPRAAEAPARPSGPAIEVVWEALARERYLLENSRYRRNGPQPPQKIILLNESHPDAARIQAGRAGDGGAQTAVISDRDMEGFLKGLEQRGFFQVARPAGYDAAAAANPNARGRVTVVRDGRGVSIISLRGQGTNEATRAVPALYSEAKQAIMVLRNMNPTLSVTGHSASGTAPVR